MWAFSSHEKLTIRLGRHNITAGGSAHLVAYIGHNVMMDFAGWKNFSTGTVKAVRLNPDNEVIVLACIKSAIF